MFDSYILTIQEVGVMMKHYSSVLTSCLPFMETARGNYKQHYFRCYRFTKLIPSSGDNSSGWPYGGSRALTVLSLVSTSPSSYMEFSISALKVANTQFIRKLKI